EFPTGLLLAEASHGSLQRYLDNHYDTIPLSLRKKWFLQAIESVAYIHNRGVIHSDLRPDNFLVHSTDPTSLDLWLCDFGAATCEEQLGLAVGGLPDAGVFDPNSKWEPTPATDIFSLGSVLYTILKGHWPYRALRGSFDSLEEMEQYETLVDDRFKQGIFPDVKGLFGGEVIMGCWSQKYSDMNKILEDVAPSKC
ncbi:kinase-like domain-containing protein, partial [Calycina marina]